MSHRLPSLLPALLAVLIAALPAGAQQSAPLPLIPAPREVETRPALSLRRGVWISASDDADDQFAAKELGEALGARGVRIAAQQGPGVVTMTLARTESAAGRSLLARTALRVDPAMHDEGYVLITDSARVDIVGATAAGVFYGTQTVLQLVQGSGDDARLLGARIRDWPAMRWRGIQDDLSRGALPTLDYQKKQIRTFAAYKLNVYSPYFEHTLAYNSQPLVAAPGGTLSHDEIRELVAYAARYHIDVIPEQEAFGHLHHLLKYELYSPLAELPHGHVLAPGQNGSMTLIKQMYAELDSLFPSHFQHLGADETLELGRGQTADRVRSESLEKVYIDFLTRVENALRPSGKRFLFWGDIVLQHAELVRTLPKDLIAVPWEYEPKPSYENYIAPFRAAGMETWVAPGVNNWSRVYPDYARALPDIQRFVRDGQKLGASGVLNTTWNDDGESLFDQTWYGVLFGAAAGWQRGESDIAAFQLRYGRAFHGDTTGLVDSAQRDLAAAHALIESVGAGDGNNVLFWMDPWSAEGQQTAAKLRPQLHDVRRLAEQAMVSVALARRAPLRETDALEAIALGARRMDFIGMKFQLADEVGQLYQKARDTTDVVAVRRILSDISGINGRLQDLRDGYSLMRDEYERAWNRENRPYWLHNVLARYDQATQLWITRADRAAAVRREYTRTHVLPAASELGIP